MSSNIIVNVPIIGTNCISSKFFVQFYMTIKQKEKILELLYRYKQLGFEYIDPLHLTKCCEIDGLPNNIEELDNHILNCSLCNRSKIKENFKSELNRSHSDIMIIFQTNITLENKELFSMFTNMMEKVLQWSIDELYITYIVKCVSKVSIDKSELDICKNYIYKEIEIVQPKLIITFGKAYNTILNSKENILNISGQVLNYRDITLIPMIDLEFLYKNPSYKQKVFNDLKKIKFKDGR